MTIDRPIVFLDLETTGTDPVADRIIEIGVSVVKSDMERTRWSCRFNPGMPIPAAATAVHGITDEMVAGCPTFAEKAVKILSWIQGKDLAGYNLMRFDLPMLDEEARRCGYRIDLAGIRVIDVAGIFFKKESRKLEDAVRRYCGREHEGAHGAQADSDATADVLFGQLREYPDLAAMSLDELAAFSRTSDQTPVDLAGKLYRDAAGFVCYGFGKNKDKRVLDDHSYANWMLKSNFPGSTLDALDVELRRELAA